MNRESVRAKIFSRIDCITCDVAPIDKNIGCDAQAFFRANKGSNRRPSRDSSLALNTSRKLKAAMHAAKLAGMGPSRMHSWLTRDSGETSLSRRDKARRSNGGLIPRDILRRSSCNTNDFCDKLTWKMLLCLIEPNNGVSCST